MNKNRCLLLLALPALAILGACSPSAMADSGLVFPGDASAVVAPPKGNDYVSNPSFEEQMLGWAPFIPSESSDKNCKVSLSTVLPHSGIECCQLQSDDFARFSVASRAFHVQAGDRYRVTVWVRADPGAAVKEGTPGIMLRLGLSNATNEPATGRFQFIGLDGTVARTTIQDPTFGNHAGKLPTEWKKIEAVILIPADGDSMGTDIFAWSTKGSIFIDDFTIAKVADSSIPTTQVIEPTPGPKP
jgi:hypothetical protein